MKLPVDKIKEAFFKERLNRYLTVVEGNGVNIEAHLPNPGRMKELLVPGARVLIREEPGSDRKTGYDLIAVYSGEVLVSVDSRLPNRLIEESLEEGSLPELGKYKNIKKEPFAGRSRLDFLLDNSCYIEVKSCTLVIDKVALFPDAPTLRGRRHMHELATLVKKGMRGVVFFVVQRPDALRFNPNDRTDPEFGTALRFAAASGVEIMVYVARVTRESIHLWKRIPVEL